MFRVLLFCTVILISSPFSLRTTISAQDAKDQEVKVPKEEVSEKPEDTKLVEENSILANLQLRQLNGVKIGYEQQLELFPGQFYTAKTISLRPLLFEIPNFLSNEECDHIIKLAEEKELMNSTTLEDIEEYEEEAEEIDMGMEELFNGLDENKDGFLDIDEIVNSLEIAHGGFFSENDIKDMYKDLEMDPDGNDLLNVNEFVAVNESLIRTWLDERTERGGANKVRDSKQTWLQQTTSNDTVLRALRERVIKLTGLPRSVIENSEQLQVVYYGLGGHYHAHYDSEDVVKHENATCGQMGFNYSDNDNMTYRLCRFMTILYYLNDVEDGGETAFPIANNETFSAESLHAAGNKLYDLSNHCIDANVVVKPNKGKAILWYNHLVDDETGWMGEMDNFTIHGGCDVRIGKKWIANNWINVADSREEQAAFDKYIVEVFRNDTVRKEQDKTEATESSDQTELEEKSPEADLKEKSTETTERPVDVDAPPVGTDDTLPERDIQIEDKEEL